MSLPPLDRVPVVVACPCCAQLVRTTVSWADDQPRPSCRQRCPWCAHDVLLLTARPDRI